MNDQIAAAAKAHPELEVVFADAAPGQRQAGVRRRELPAQGIDC